MALTLTACQTESSDRHVRLGMSRDALRAKFGEPSHIERNDSGGEDWYYTFRTWSKSEPGAETTRDAYTDTPRVDFSVTRTWTTEEQPVHLSHDGYIIEPVPTGKIVGNSKTNAPRTSIDTNHTSSGN